jgi:integrase
MPHATQSQRPTLIDLVAKLLYGSGLRIMEAIRLRGKDIALPMQQLTVCSGKSDLDHCITLRLAAARTERARSQKPRRTVLAVWSYESLASSPRPVRLFVRPVH